MAEEEYLGENSDTPFAQSIQGQVEQTIKDGLADNNMATRMKAASLAEKMGLLKVKDRNVKISQTSESITDLLLALCITYNLGIGDILNRMFYFCLECPKMKAEGAILPKVIE